MQHTGAVEMNEPLRGRDAQDADAILPSRLAALNGLRDGLLRQAGPLLLTGPPGVGKTWLARLLRAGMPAEWRWIGLDLSASITPGGLGRGVLRGLGLSSLATGSGQADWRGEIEDALAESDADRRRWVLVADEAHAAADEVLEELRVLGNRLGEPGGLGGLVLVGQTALARRLERKPLDGLGLRLAARVHLRPLGVEELRDGMARLDSAWGRDDRALERLHRETGGIPGLAFRQAIGGKRPDDPFRGRLEVPRPESDEPRGAPNRPALDLTGALPARPPLQVGEGVVEVGWDAMAGTAEVEADALEPADVPRLAVDDAAGEPSPAGHPGLDPSDVVAEGVRFDGLVSDRYAALQAWAEWSSSRELESDRPPPDDLGDERTDPFHPAPDDEVPGPDGEVPERQPRPGTAEADRTARPGVRVEGQHGFAPYSQLFSRLRLPHDVP